MPGAQSLLLKKVQSLDSDLIFISMSPCILDHSPHSVFKTDNMFNLHVVIVKM